MGGNKSKGNNEKPTSSTSDKKRKKYLKPSEINAKKRYDFEVNIPFCFKLPISEIQP